MLTPETIEKMNAMKLFGLVSAFETQLSSSGIQGAELRGTCGTPGRCRVDRPRTA